jgi:acetyltransferase-like isoleucine patch superfamily enzyme
MNFIRKILLYAWHIVYLRAGIRKRADLGEHITIADYVDIVDSRLERFANVAHHAQITGCVVGARTSVGRYSKLRDADIGKFCSISWDVTIGATTHPFEHLSSHSFSYMKKFGLVSEDKKFPQLKTYIGNDVWIGCHSVIRSGVTIGDGAIIGAGAVVTKDVPPYSIVVGVPAKILRMRFPTDICKELIDIRWWDWPDELIRENITLFGCVVNEDMLEKCRKIKRQNAF